MFYAVGREHLTEARFENNRASIWLRTMKGNDMEAMIDEGKICQGQARMKMRLNI